MRLPLCGIQDPLQKLGMPRVKLLPHRLAAWRAGLQKVHGIAQHMRQPVLSILCNSGKCAEFATRLGASVNPGTVVESTVGRALD